MKRRDLGSFRLAYAAWLFGVFAFFLPTATWNPVSRFDLTRAIVEHRSLEISPYVTSTGDRAFVDGRWYTDKPPLVSLVAAPVYALVRLGQAFGSEPPSYKAYGSTLHPAVRLIPNKSFQQALYACSLATNGVAGIAVGLLLFELLRRRTTSRVAFLSSVLVVLGTPLLPYSTSFYSHVPSAACLLGAIVCLDRRGERPLGAPLSNTRLWLAGLCLAMAPGCEYLTAAPAALIGVWALASAPRGERLRVARQLALGGALPVLVVGAYHTAAFGVPWRTGYSFITNPEFAAGQASGLFGIHPPHASGLYGLVFGLRRGLFHLSPVAVVGVMLGVLHVRRRRDAAFAVGLACLGLLYLLNAGYYMWWGGAAAGPRHMVPGLPFLAAGVMVGLRARQRWVRLLTGALGIISIANVVVLTIVGLEAPEKSDLLYDYAWPHLFKGELATYQGGSNLGLKLGLHGSAALLPLLLWGTLGFFYLSAQLKRGEARFALETSSASG